MFLTTCRIGGETLSFALQGLLAGMYIGLHSLVLMTDGHFPKTLRGNVQTMN